MGIHVGAGKRGFTYIAYDNDRRTLAIGQGQMEEVLFFAAGQSSAVISLSAPASPAPVEETAHSTRPVERLLAERELPFHPAPVEDRCPAWARRGLLLYRRLQEIGYQAYPAEGDCQWMETPVEAAYQSLAGCTLYAPESLEGRLQRQILLYEQGLPMNDPFLFFEEITRHRLMHSALPMQDIHPTAELAAMLCAQTAWLAVHHPAQVLTLGGPDEDRVVLPLPARRA